MKPKNPNRIDQGGNGTLFGNVFRFISKNGLKVGSGVVKALTTGNPTAILSAFNEDPEISHENVDLLIAELQKDIEYEKELTLRWISDNKQEHWLPKLIRPLVLANYTILVDVVILSSIWGKPLEQMFLPLILSLAATVTGGYFALREFGKTRK